MCTASMVRDRELTHAALVDNVLIKMLDDEGGLCGRIDVITLEKIKHLHHAFGDHATIGCAADLGKVRLATTTVLSATRDSRFGRANVGDGDLLACGGALGDL